MSSRSDRMAILSDRIGSKGSSNDDAMLA